MLPLSAHQIIQVWERGQSLHPIDRGLLLLAMALPERSPDELARLSIGQRDALLLTLREMTLGQTMESFAHCPHCDEQLEFSLKVTDLRMVHPVAVPTPQQRRQLDGYDLCFTLPNSLDLAAVAGCSDLITAQRQLAQRCLQQVTREGIAIAFCDLPDAVLQGFAQSLGECDPQSELLLNLDCPNCRHPWQMLFDIVSFFWTELAVQAKRLLHEVHLLARSYGWREADILSMSATRRQFYLSLVSG